MILANLALSRSTLDRAAHRRDDPELLTRLLEQPSTRVLVMIGDQAPVTAEGSAALVLRPGPDVAHLAAADAVLLVAYLGTESGTESGTDAEGIDHLLIALPAGAPMPRDATPPADGRTRLAVLREVGVDLDDTQAGLFTTALALVNWHATHPRCSRCGEPTRVAAAGWTRHCDACDTDHFPRTDPAVIMTVVDDADRLMLGRQAVWPDKRFSTLAGFVEPGESVEAAVRREVFEEAGIEVGEVTYLGSQPWPFPSSLMLAYRARALSTQAHVDGVELAEARWWSREDLALDVATGELVLAPPLSVSRALIEDWYGGPIRDGAATWR
ncbi:MAG: NAD(+) diphosphatase [Kineosporiaceae bacterium]|nr:NAD(+) diphosphatase [Kineosporiaceae bacterium]